MGQDYAQPFACSIGRADRRHVFADESYGALVQL
jgi:hypothetical protein